ncbi:hypothetical protein ANO11243_089150 [Dothideomycetidae sp. 11243]|nr:hypothetical protein ANO11243_089150 [fungal sp. No.11243]
MRYLLPFVSLVSAASALPACTPASFSTFLDAGATVVAATRVENNGTFNVPPGNLAYPTDPTQLRSLCALQINVTSSNSSAYQFGLFLPDNWNERFLAVGSAGFGGGINWIDMAAGVGYGFASMSTDTGHSSIILDGSWALNHPETMIDWGYRAMHGSVVAAKQIIVGYYGCNIKYNYYSGCSTGGRQGLKDLELYPEDFDGVIAGCAAWWTTHLQTWTVKVGSYNLPVNGTGHIPVPLFSVIEREILRQCDPQDGVRDGIISDPRRCNIYFNALLCPADETANATAFATATASAPGIATSTCLTAPQIKTLQSIYTDWIETNQTFVFPRLEPGSEAQWSLLVGGNEPASLGIDYVQDFLLNDTTWSYTDFDYSIVDLAERINPSNGTADNFDLSAFRNRGGKLLTYHGTADGLIATGSSVYFYNAVYKTMVPQGVADISDFFRFFLVPGMQHCSGTPTLQQAPWYFAGPNQASLINSSVHSTPGFSDPEHDILLAVMEWTERGIAPEKIVATVWNGTVSDAGVLRQRPLCAYPHKAYYMGGNVNKSSSWECGCPY